jgi:hypothetical protein
MKKLIAIFCLFWVIGGGSWTQAATPPGLVYPLRDWRFSDNGTAAGTLPQTYALRDRLRPDVRRQPLRNREQNIMAWFGH